jgi:hypothetical protein
VSEEEHKPTEEEMRAAIEEQLRRISVRDVLLQTVVTLVNLTSRRLGLGGDEGAEEDRDLEQARLGIEAVRALLPLMPDEEAQPVKDALAQLQMAYAREAQAKPAEPEGGSSKAQSKIWTPPGS